MSHSIETFTADVISTCRANQDDLLIENNAHLSPEIYVSWDDEDGRVELKAQTDANMLLALEAQVSQEPRWFSLNIGLGQGALKVGDVLGIVFETESARAFYSAPFCRSALEENHGDTYWQDGLDVKGEGRQISTLLHTVEPGDPLIQEAFHTLVIPLPCQAFSLTLHDMRLFVVEAGRGFRSTSAQAASVG